MIHVAYPWILYGGGFIFLAAVWWRFTRYRGVVYRYPLAYELAAHGKGASVKKYAASILRALALFCLLLLAARIQLPHAQSPVAVQGIDIVMALDVSGSMNAVDDLKDGRSRLEVAKDEAINFVKKRHHDQIGLVLFARDCLSRCPLTLDKKILTSLLDEVEIGIIDQNGTFLSTGIAVAVNRLKNSRAQSKIIIALTDGAPSEGDLAPEAAIELAKKFGIKIYTIGIGADEPMYIGFGMAPPLNKRLLQSIAQATGGKFFEAKKPQDMQHIYQEINRLEKTAIDAEIFTRYREYFMPIALAAFLALCAELMLATFVWLIL